MRSTRFVAPALLASLLGLPACVTRVVETPAYSQASPYAPAPGAVAYRSDSYCAEAVAEAQDAAAQAAVTARGQDANRAARTANYARRDCR